MDSGSPARCKEVSKQESWSGNLPAMLVQDEDPIEAFRKSLQVVLGRKLAKGVTVGRVEAEVLMGLAQQSKPGRLEVGDI